MDRLKSKVAWASLFSLIVFVLKNYFNYELPLADDLINLILVTATAFGIWNDPTNRKEF